MANGVNSDLRTKAILECYGLKAVESKKCLMVGDEEITYWFIDGFLELQNLQATFSDSQIVDIYDSGE